MAGVTTSEKLKIFVSYSRRDIVFADRLVDALKARGFEVRIDRRDLPKLQDWERELLEFIRQTDTIVFIVSPHSLASKIVGWEVEQARLHSKRLAPVVIENAEGISIPPEISKINYLFFTDEALFEQCADELAHALNTDIAWLKEHTRLGELARRWVERGKPEDALIRGQDLDDASRWAARRPGEAPPVTEGQLQFLAVSRTVQENRLKREQAQITRRRRMQAFVGALVVAGLIYASWSNQSYLRAHLGRLADVIWPKVLASADEGALKPMDSFKECSSCPEMVVVPLRDFMMGSPPSEKNRRDEESPQHKVTIARPFAVSRFEVTFDEWDVCSALGGCAYQPGDQGWGRGKQPVINVSWDDAQQYVAWLSKHTGKPYRLLSESEWEYSARAGTNKAYSWDDEIGRSNANCNGCGSRWDKKQAAPVGSFNTNAFGLYDMLGNVWEWVEDCWHDNYQGAPNDGSAWTNACTDNTKHVVRGGSWDDIPADLRAAARYDGPTGVRNAINGIRLGRTLSP